MLFQTPEFLILMMAVLAGVALLRTHMLQMLLLLAASYVFYMSWDPLFIVLILFTTVSNYIAGLGIGRSERRGVHIAWLVFSCATNLGLLGVYKYLDFFIGSFNALATFTGSQATLDLLRITLPVGISFYTFQALSYTIDVYRKEIDPERSFIRFALYVAFFPQLVAGPILRSTDFLPQLHTLRTLEADNLRSGANLFLVGLIKKVLIADQLSGLVEVILGSPQGMTSILIWVGALAFGIQIYCDFSGYTDMARGAARMLGFTMPLNFNYPYAARSIADFWRRWHISLSTWLRDYLYISLGGNRKSMAYTYRNLMITMVLGGLWHGAGWNFVIWGVYQGGLLCIERALGLSRPGSADDQPPGTSRLWFNAKRIARWVIVQYFVFLGWLIFRVRGWDNIVYSIKKYLLFDFKGVPSGLGLGSVNPFMAVMVLGAFLVLHALSYRVGGFANRLDTTGRLKRSLVYFIAFCCLFALWPSGKTAFIYFQF